MTLTIDQVREWFAEDLRVVANLKSRALVDALARVPRERFVGPGPWTIFGTEIGAAARLTDDADPRHVYHNVSIAIDPARMLFNGQPALLASWLDTLAIAPGERVVHVGCATGYYTALAAMMTGASGHVHAIEIDEALAADARVRLEPWPWVSVAQGDGLSQLPADADVIIVNAGTTHVLDVWLDALSPRGRLLVPLTVTMPGMPGPISKGVVFVIGREADRWTARPGSMVTIYSMSGARSEAMNAALGRAFASHPMPRVTRLRRDPHDLAPSCWFHAETNCLSG